MLPRRPNYRGRSVAKTDSMNRSFPLDSLCSELSWSVPLDYIAFLECSFQVSPERPADAFESIGLGTLDGTIASPTYSLTKENYAEYVATPAEGAVIAWTGVNGSHFVFLLDDEPDVPVELPVARVSGDGCHILYGLSFREFLCNALSFVSEETTPLGDELAHPLEHLRRHFDLSIPEFSDETEQHAKILERRMATGAYPTEDGLGVLLPDDSIDQKYIQSANWKHANTKLLMDAEALLDDQPGTSLLLARNFRHLHYYSDWKGERRIMPWTCDILEKAYLTLGRTHAAKKIRVQTDWAMENLL